MLVSLLPIEAPMPLMNDSPTRLEVLVGRSCAMLLHPSAAWHARPANHRAALVLAYFALSYFLVLGLLQLMSA
jgi:hypothetical protein